MLAVRYDMHPLHSDRGGRVLAAYQDMRRRQPARAGPHPFPGHLSKA